MRDIVDGGDIPSADRSGDAERYRKREFWSRENLKHVQPHYRLVKAAGIANKTAAGRDCVLLDVGCGPATLQHLLQPNIHYYGIDIAIHEPAPNLIEADILETPIAFGDKQFDIVLAQGLFEYVGDFQSQKFAEIAQLLTEKGIFILSYTNFAHRGEHIYPAYNNVQSFNDFRESLTKYFEIKRLFPTSYNWNHGQPNRKLVKAVNMHLNLTVPIIGPMLAVEYFFICSCREEGRAL